MWLKIKQEGQTAGFGPWFHFPIGQPILEFRSFAPQLMGVPDVEPMAMCCQALPVPEGPLRWPKRENPLPPWRCMW